MSNLTNENGEARRLGRNAKNPDCLIVEHFSPQQN